MTPAQVPVAATVCIDFISLNARCYLVYVSSLDSLRETYPSSCFSPLFDLRAGQYTQAPPVPQEYEPVPSAPPEYNPASIVPGEDNAAPSATVAVDPYRRPTQVLLHSSKSDGLVFFAVTVWRLQYRPEASIQN
jgi:hypothetical protein